MKETILFCAECKKSFTVEISDRKFYYCPYCGKKTLPNHFISADIRHRIKLAKNPLEKWQVAEDIYELCKEKDILHNNVDQKEFAKNLGISHGLLYMYINAVEFANREGIDKKRLRITNAYELSRSNDFDLVCEILESDYRKDIYSATQKEIKDIVNDERDFYKYGILGDGV